MSQLKNIKANTALEHGRVTMSVLITAKPQFVNTKPAAFHRFKLIENKVQRDNNYKQQYHEFMADLISKKEAILANHETDNSWYIPHCGVYRPRKPNKISVVFDCAAKVGRLTFFARFRTYEYFARLYYCDFAQSR